MKKEKQIKPGTRFFILCRNKDGNPTEICQYLFLARIANAAEEYRLSLAKLYFD